MKDEQVVPEQTLTCLPPMFDSPYMGDWDYSKNAIIKCLGVEKIEDQPVAKATIYYPSYTDTIEAGVGKHYGLAFLYYCLARHSTNEEKAAKRFEVTPRMVAEAFLYYGPALWSDDRNDHPSIHPFRIAAQDAKVYVELTFEPHH